MSEEIVEEIIEETPLIEAEEVEEQPEPDKVPKGVQKRIDEITREKYEERRERQRAQERADRLEQELHSMRNGTNQQMPRALPNGAPDPDQFAAGRYDPDYLEALTDFKVQQRFDAQTIHERKASLQQAEAKARETYADYDMASEEFLTHPLAKVSAFTNLVLESDNPTEIAYYLGKNPAELDKISDMTASQAARYIGRIEGLLAEQTSGVAVKKASSAPKPISALSGAKNSSVITDLSQAKSMAEYNALRDKQQAKK
jgi:hypothetical protein